MAWNDVVSTIAQRDPYRPVSSKTFIACVFGVQWKSFFVAHARKELYLCYQS